MEELYHREGVLGPVSPDFGILAGPPLRASTPRLSALRRRVGERSGADAPRRSRGRERQVRSVDIRLAQRGRIQRDRRSALKEEEEI